MKIILASKSPRRKELMDLLKVNYEILVSDEEEVIDETLELKEKIKKIAYDKAVNVLNKTIGDRIIISADTVVVKDDVIYGKPKTKSQAFEMISKLQNDKHQVITSVCILIKNKNQKLENYNIADISTVTINEMSQKEINNWLDSEQYIDKAGAYGIQTEFTKYIEKIDGNYNSIVGMPINFVYKILKKYVEI